ncbi:MAG TPA: ABC transporter permease [Candidatus Mediterraneibacter norfolkensis]|nr:ABC transporter permease [Candidatus Mediterraneibacter norfolkensis]
MKSAIYAIIRKDIRSVTSNRQLFLPILLVPLIMIVVLPTIFVVTVRFVPEEAGDLDALLSLLPVSALDGGAEQALIQIILNNILPVFFLIIPIMTSSVMAAGSFVGEKEKHTLETLLYCPLPLGRIFYAKIMASFLMSMMVSLLSFAVMLAFMETELFILFGALTVPSLNWLIMLFLLSPAVSLIAITLIVRGSAKAQTMEESQQKAVFLILPLILLIVGQFSGVLLVSGWLLLILALACGAAAWFLMRGCRKWFTCESLLK